MPSESVALLLKRRYAATLWFYPVALKATLSMDVASRAIPFTFSRYR
jgi:hypothetical protein